MILTRVEEEFTNYLWSSLLHPCTCARRRRQDRRKWWTVSVKFRNTHLYSPWGCGCKPFSSDQINTSKSQRRRFGAFPANDSSLSYGYTAFYSPTYLPKNPRDLARPGQAHRVTSFLGLPWPLAISFVLGSQIREQICNNGQKNTVMAMSDSLWMYFEQILGSMLCPHLSSSPQLGLGCARNYVSSRQVYPKATED